MGVDAVGAGVEGELGAAGFAGAGDEPVEHAIAEALGAGGGVGDEVVDVEGETGEEEIPDAVAGDAADRAVFVGVIREAEAFGLHAADAGDEIGGDEMGTELRHDGEAGGDFGVGLSEGDLGHGVEEGGWEMGVNEGRRREANSGSCKQGTSERQRVNREWTQIHANERVRGRQKKTRGRSRGFLKHETWRDLENQAAAGAAGRAMSWRRWRTRRPTRPAMKAAPSRAATVEASGTGAGTTLI